MNSRNCMIVAAGKGSRHKEWIKGNCDFDLHLLVYDDSADKWAEDTPYICKLHGYKLKMTYAYLTRYPEIIEKYDYFLLADDDISMTSEDVNNIFRAMRKYNLKIAQPSLVDSYYSWTHTLHDDLCRLRYTDFVEVMIPCFSREALRTVLFTFNENDCGWGTEAHWPLLIKTDHRDMAIIDEVKVVHTRPVQSGTPQNFRDLDAYLKKYNLVAAAHEYGFLETADKLKYLFGRERYNWFKNGLESWIRYEAAIDNRIGLDGYYGYILLLAVFARLSNARKYADIAVALVDQMHSVGNISADFTLAHGITGCCFATSYLIAKGYVDDSSGCTLKCVEKHIIDNFEQHKDRMSYDELVSIGLYFLTRLSCDSDGVYEQICKKIIIELSKRDLTPETTADLHTLCGAMELMSWQGMATDPDMLNLVENGLDSLVQDDLNRLCILCRLYKLTGNQVYKKKISDLAETAIFDITDIQQALMFANLLTIRI